MLGDTLRISRRLDTFQHHGNLGYALLAGLASSLASIALNMAPNPYRRVMPASMLNGGHRGYDREKYAELVERSIRNLLRPLTERR